MLKIIEKLPPHDIDAEEATIGSLLIDGYCLGKIINLLQVSDFYSERQGFIYNACLNLYKDLSDINQITVAQELVRNDKLEACGGAAYLSHLIANCFSSVDVVSYAEIVHRLAVSRRLIFLAERISNLGYQADPDISGTLSQISDMTNQFRKENLTTTKLITPYMAGNEILSMLSKYNDHTFAVQWGFRDLDRITAGIFPEYIVIGARPSVGKTQLMLDIAENVANQKRHILFVSAEMTATQIYERKLSRVVEIDILELRKKGINSNQADKLVELSGAVSETPISYLAGDIYLNDVHKEALSLLDKKELDIIFIDYLGALRDCYTDGKDNQNVRISKISNRLQSMVHELKVPIIIASQLNREIEKRGEDTKPQLSDLRDSGSIEQDADVVFLLHRSKDELGGLSQTLEITMAKNRQLGSQPPISLYFDTKTHRYMDSTNRGEND
jgi:replicative DNA helicase